MKYSTPKNSNQSSVSVGKRRRVGFAGRVIILAAGTGRRLHPLTRSMPKCLLQVGDETILGHTLLALEEAGAWEVLLITGHCAETLKSAVKTLSDSCAPKFLFNPYYAQYNNSYSLWLARQYLRDGFILYNSDVITTPNLIRRVVSSKESDFLVIDEVKEYEEEAMKVKVEGERIVAIAKELGPEDYNGEYIGIAKFSPEVGEQLYYELCRLTTVTDGFNKFYESAIANLLGRYPIKKFTTDGEPWIEIDDFADLAKAQKMALLRQFGKRHRKYGADL